MSQIIKCISSNNVGIKFRDYGGRKRRPTIKQRVKRVLSSRNAYFWALKDITFDLPYGEVLCIIGRNGAGKTTLLKTLGGILPPDSGVLHVNGKINAFLSMGLGFRPELNGYDNINLSLAFMGFHKKEIIELTKSIEDFCCLGKYLNSPVKYYSAGMKARLAFSIATSVEPDILIMDEVINAGDEEFRERCNERVKNMMETAQAVVIATHSMPQVLALADTVMWIEKGKMVFMGNPKEGVDKYVEFIKEVRKNPFYELENKE